MYPTYYKPVNRRTPKPKEPSADLVMSAERIWGAAAYADRLNGGEYRKEPEYLVREDGTFTQDVVRHANKKLMWQAITDTSLLTEEDLHQGRLARDWRRKDLVIKTLKGTLTDFEQALSHAVEMDEFLVGSDRYEIALITSQIRAHRDSMMIEEAMTGIRREPMAPVGEKVTTEATVIKAVYSQNFNVYFITAITPDRYAVFFSYRERMAIGRKCQIRGTVKAHRENSTQLNRVRVA